MSKLPHCSLQSKFVPVRLLEEMLDGLIVPCKEATIVHLQRWHMQRECTCDCPVCERFQLVQKLSTPSRRIRASEDLEDPLASKSHIS